MMISDRDGKLLAEYQPALVIRIATQEEYRAGLVEAGAEPEYATQVSIRAAARGRYFYWVSTD